MERNMSKHQDQGEGDDESFVETARRMRDEERDVLDALAN
jgi:hypothetical protein